MTVSVSAIDTVVTVRRLDRMGMTAIVQRALGDDGVEVDAWDVHPLGDAEANPISAGIQRIAGTAYESSRRLS